ncbi:bestrophin-like domain [Pseudomonas turukhanskensis]|uniref:DUF4239 domain-containing protein n=1 Tax=Pseudomonas turukhanskensis TaxID=1806536 RepID=A0A9W6K5U9_9PSED|nr:DUF4239 domain-containing protein [Pseudomonas turukhanskensis]GLK88054.1 hypothetical protein GCM10017655_11160 [Pseudomonas turukhanskensis]
MELVWTAFAIFACLFSAALLMMRFCPMLPSRHRDEETSTVVRLLANLFVVMTSLVFGLLINSAKNTFEAIDADVHVFATKMIILDRALRTYGPNADEARKRLEEYVQQAIDHPSHSDDALHQKPSVTAQYLDRVGEALRVIKPPDRYHETMLVEARQQYHGLMEQRWKVLEQSEGVIPQPLIVMLVAWMTLIFAAFGYHAPRNAMMVGMFGVSALLIAVSVALVLDMDIPFSGPIQISDAPQRRALAEIQM